MGFYVFVLFYTILAFLLIAPLVSWSRVKEEKEQEVKESNEKQVDIEQRKDPDSQRPSNEDPKQHPSKQAPDSSLPKRRKGYQDESKNSDKKNYHNGDSLQNGAGGNQKRDIKKQSSPSFVVSDSDLLSKNSRHTASKSVISSSRSRRSSTLKSVVLRELDQSYPDQDPDFQNRIALRFPIGANGVAQPDQQISRFLSNNNNGDGRSGAGGSSQPTETSSSVPSSSVPSVPSAATTGQIHQNLSRRENPSDKGFSKLVLDVSGRRWKNRRPIGRADVIENVFSSNSVKQPRSAIAGRKTKIGGSSAEPDGKKLNAGTGSFKKGGQSGIPQQSNLQQKPIKGMSDIASSILSEQYHQLNHQPEVQIDISLMKKYQLEQLRLQQQYQMQNQMQFFAMQRLQQNQRRYPHQRRYSRFGTRSVSEQSASVMSSIIDDISPEDAADANDPGRGNIFIQPDEKYRITEKEFKDCCETDFGPAKDDCCSSRIDGLLLSAVPDVEKWNIFQTSIPLTLGASSESLFRLITVAFISQYLGTKSMIGKLVLYWILLPRMVLFVSKAANIVISCTAAFLLVGLFVRLTSEELSSAIIDALSAFVQASMDKTYVDAIKSNYIAGQYIQLAFVLQVVLNIPLLAAWVYFMKDFIMWLVADKTIAIYASDYATVVVFAYIVQALSRTLTVVFHICGHEHFESIIDFMTAVLQVVAIACVVTLVHEADLKTVGCIQGTLYYGCVQFLLIDVYFQGLNYLLLPKC